MRKLILLLGIALLVGGCGTPQNDTNRTEFKQENTITDGTHNAEVTYSNTGSTYTISVDVDNNNVIQINFDNGGYISCFAPLNSGRHATVEHEGNTYEVQIIN